MIDALSSPESIAWLRSTLYPFGFLSSIAFSSRFLIQWYLSEKAGYSVVPKIFWYLSLIGYCFLFIHSFIQGQFPMYILQSLHFVLGWRNLNFTSSHPKKFKTVLFFLFLSPILATGLYMSQQYFLPEGAFCWVRSPANKQVAGILHAMGTLGVLCFALRFWIQWIDSELKRKSTFNNTFWYISLFGAVLSSSYFIIIHDWVNLTGPITGIIPYIRNLILIKKQKKIENG